MQPTLLLESTPTFHLPEHIIDEEMEDISSSSQMTNLLDQVLELANANAEEVPWHASLVAWAAPVVKDFSLTIQ
jgi:hypothetical protein